MILTNEFFSPTSTIPDQAIIELIDEFTFEPYIYVQYIPPAPTSTNPSPIQPFVDGIVRRKRNNIYYLNKTVHDSGEPVDVGIFGAKGDGETDDTESINNAVLYLSAVGKGALKFNGSKTYLINQTIYITSNIIFYCNGATFSGNAARDNTIMETAYLETVSDQVKRLLPNLNIKYGTHVIVSSQIKDANFVSCGTGLHFVNFCHGCSLENITFSDCISAIKFDNCFYTVLKNIIATHVSREIPVPDEYCYQFLGQNNALLLERMTATRNLGFLFTNGTTATTIISPTTEGGNTGMKFEQDCLGITINGLYAEYIKDVIDLSDVRTGNFEISNCYFNFTDRPLIGPDLFGPPNNGKEDREVTGSWSNNSIVNINGVYKGYTYRGLMDVSQERNYIKYELPTYEGDGSLPSNWIVGDFTNITSYGHVKASDSKAIGNIKRQFGVIPVTRSGNVGDGKEGIIPDCTHEVMGADPSNFGIKIKTKIKFQEYMMFAKYNIYIGTYSYGRWFYGDIFGKNLSSKDVGNTQITSIENENGLLVITITGFNEPNLNYFIQGNVQLIV
ncbi:pectate lyase family protein [Chryseobacterium jejuense]|uniref:Pectate lyase superfamily protein n=1 Tax=Chryseobacterium jejuense TaxID=445960 RepID=A0A2X2VEV4_CHRJE|nr:glycosyl hydrolase family 28-related protein [Chryseobacterium jejuense]SDI85479.1 Pectate lyase superfamily protein [Chryseobacterium jejuense]SQB27606.1 Pectate lyase superfamily protein [Chryseobacterium jejuense]